MKKEGFWPRLLADKAKEKNNVTVDWDKYIDEEDEDFEYADEVMNLDALIAEEEEENLITEDIIANVEYHSMFPDESIAQVTLDTDCSQ